MAHDLSLLKKEHPAFASMKVLWRFFWQSYEGGHNYITGGRRGSIAEGTGVTTSVTNEQNLIRHPREPQAIFDRRLDRAYFINYCGAIIDTYKSHLNKDDPIIEVGETGWDKFVLDVNRRGDSLKEFHNRGKWG